MLYGIDSFLNLVIDVYSLAIFIYILMSWFPNARETTFGQFMASICEPFLEPFRRIIPPLGMMDFSPIVALIVLRWLVPKGIDFIFLNLLPRLFY